MIDADALRTSEDFYHAAIIFQHGFKAEHYHLAHKLALMAVELDPTSMKAAWISCATEDRYLLSKGEPQVWGTQFVVSEENGEISHQLPYDKDARTEQEKRRKGILTLEEIKEVMMLQNKKQSDKKALRPETKLQVLQRKSAA